MPEEALKGFIAKGEDGHAAPAVTLNPKHLNPAVERFSCPAPCA